MSSDDPKKPQRTVLRPMPSAPSGGAKPPEGGPGHGSAPPAGGPPPAGGAGQGDAPPAGGRPSPRQQPQKTVIGQMPPAPGGGGRGGGSGFGGPDFDRPDDGGGYGQQPQGGWPGAGQGQQGGGWSGQGGQGGGWPGEPGQPSGGYQPGSPGQGWGNPSQPGYGQGGGIGSPGPGNQGGYGNQGSGSPFDSYAPAGQQGQGGHWLGTAGTDDTSFFPDQRRPEPVQRAPTRKIPLEDALRVHAAGLSAEVNPITAAAASLLILFGRLRSQIVEMQAVPLMAHVTEEITAFEKRVLQAGVDPQDALVAKYALCGTADDIVQNLPGTDRDVWIQYSMVARFFNKRTSGVGFFQEVEKAMADPARKYYLLELMLTCLQLGFEGQFRGMPGGDVELQRIRRRIYETLRSVKPRGDDDVSPHWKGQEIAMRRGSRGLPVWVVACIAAAILVGSYMVMRQFITNQGDALAERIIAVNPTAPVRITQIAAVPPPPPKPYKPPVYKPPPQQGPTELERVQKALASDIKDNKLTVDQHGDYINVTVNNLVLFASGQATTKPDFKALGERIAKALDAEKGKILIVGHTDNVPLSGRGRFKNNFDLSVARAKSVAKIIAAGLKDPKRIEIQGKGSDEPIASNKTKEGRAKNRRVEILLQRDDTSPDTGNSAKVVAGEATAKPKAGN